MRIAFADLVSECPTLVAMRDRLPLGMDGRITPGEVVTLAEGDSAAGSIVATLPNRAGFVALVDPNAGEYTGWAVWLTPGPGMDAEVAAAVAGARPGRAGWKADVIAAARATAATVAAVRRAAERTEECLRLRAECDAGIAAGSAVVAPCDAQRGRFSNEVESGNSYGVYAYPRGMRDGAARDLARVDLKCDPAPAGYEVPALRTGPAPHGRAYTLAVPEGARARLVAHGDVYTCARWKITG